MMYVPVLLSVAIVEESELISVCYRWRVDLFLFSCGCWRKHVIDTFIFQLLHGVLKPWISSWRVL